MKLECAWCGKTLQDGAGDVSHGICPECRKGQEIAILEGEVKELRRVVKHYEELQSIYNDMSLEKDEMIIELQKELLNLKKRG